MTRHKFNARPTVRAGQRFDSKKEAAYYDALVLRQRAGEVIFFLRQCPFHLPAGVRYVVDFVVFRSDGEVEFVDVKGVRTETYRAKRRMVEALYPVTIVEA